MVAVAKAGGARLRELCRRDGVEALRLQAVGADVDVGDAAGAEVDVVEEATEEARLEPEKVADGERRHVEGLDAHGLVVVLGRVAGAGGDLRKICPNSLSAPQSSLFTLHSSLFEREESESESDTQVRTP